MLLLLLLLLLFTIDINIVSLFFRLVKKRFESFNYNFRLQTFSNFQTNSSKNQQLEVVSDLFISQIRQITGCSTCAAKAISDRFGGTMVNFYNALSKLDFTAAMVI